MKLSEKYIDGLKKVYLEIGKGKEFPEGKYITKSWEQFEKVVHGASAEDLLKLKTEYPKIPQALINLLEFADGTYYRDYGDKQVIFYFLGSAYSGYPYYLLSASQIFENRTRTEVMDIDPDYFDNENFDEKIRKDVESSKWLHFSDCMNNGGTSQLYIDFTPSEKGTAGQVIMYVHDPDEYKVIADSFDNYLEMLINNNYDFIIEDIFND